MALIQETAKDSDQVYGLLYKFKVIGENGIAH